MRTRTFIIMLITAAELIACKEISVGLNDDAQDALDCIAGSSCDDENSSNNPNDSRDDDDDDGNAGYGNDDSDEDGDGSSSSSSGSSSGSSGGSSTGVDIGDSTGGIEILPTGRKGSNRFFMGTYKINTSSYNNCGDDYWGNGYDLPGVIRAYSHGDSIDFEDNFGNLRWIATVYPDDTFDYNMQFLDSFGNPSNIVACTCYIEEPYSYSYDSDTMKCTCDPMAPDDKTCSITYDMM